MPEQQVDRPDWLSQPLNEWPMDDGPFDAGRYALQLERDITALTERLERSKAAIQYLEEWGGNSVKRDNAELTAEVGRLRAALAKSESDPKVSTTPIEEEPFPFPPADQPAPATKPCPRKCVNGKITVAAATDPVWCDCPECDGAGRVPAPEDKNPCTFPRCDCTSAVCPKGDRREDRLVPGYDIPDPHEEGNR